MDGTGMSVANMKSLVSDNGGNNFLWIILFLFLIGGSGFGFGNNAAATMAANYATQQDITNAINAQTSALNQQSLLMQGENSKYETANLINGQTNTYLQLHAADQSNMLQGFNAINMTIMNSANTLASKLDGITAHMDECCCSIKQLIKDNQIAELTNQLNAAGTAATVQAGNAYVLSQMGHWTPNTTTTTTP
jgi:hypothetical protein